MTAFDLHDTWKERISELRPGEHKARVKTFAWLLVGIVLSKSVHSSHVANQIPGSAQKTSVTRRLSRLLDNTHIRVREWHEPIVRMILNAIASKGGEVRLLLDGSKIGSGHQLLMVAVAYRKRAIPIAWTWVRCRRGHSSSHKQCALLAYVRKLMPPDATVIVVGDSEFGAMPVMRQLKQWKWSYVLRHKGDTLVFHPKLCTWVRFDSLVKAAGDSCWIKSVSFTQKHCFPTNVLAYWMPGEETPWLLTTNLDCPKQTLRTYKIRMWIEEMFGDFKGHGFDLESTRLHHFMRLSRLTLVVALAYVWLVAFGSSVIKRGLRYLVDRSDRRDLSIFRIGYDMFERRMTNQQTVPIRLLPYF
jgi:hypothetical protein